MQKQAYSIYQHTFFHDISCKGVGIHSGKEVLLTLKPAPSDHGIVFKRTDLKGQPEIPATYEYVIPTRLCTRVGLTPKVSVSTIEHLMAALAAFEIDNVLIEINGPEVPIMDGSSGPFVALFQCAGKIEQEKKRLYIRIKEPLVLEANGKKIALLPKNELSIYFQALSENADVLLNNQFYKYNHSWSSFKQEVGAARTVAFYDEISQLQANGLGLGGSLDNTVVLKEGKVLNSEGLRYDNEFARHKALDALGDLYLLGHPILGEFSSIGGGHSLNAKIVQEIMNTPKSFEIETLSNLAPTHKPILWKEAPCLIYTTNSPLRTSASASA